VSRPVNTSAPSARSTTRKAVSDSPSTPELPADALEMASVDTGRPALAGCEPEVCVAGREAPERAAAPEPEPLALPLRLPARLPAPVVVAAVDEPPRGPPPAPPEGPFRSVDPRIACVPCPGPP
jgi:hypothetical protein